MYGRHHNVRYYYVKTALRRKPRAGNAKTPVTSAPEAVTGADAVAGASGHYINSESLAGSLLLGTIPAAPVIPAAHRCFPDHDGADPEQPSRICAVNAKGKDARAAGQPVQPLARNPGAVGDDGRGVPKIWRDESVTTFRKGKTAAAGFVKVLWTDGIITSAIIISKPHCGVNPRRKRQNARHRRAGGSDGRRRRRRGKFPQRNRNAVSRMPRRLALSPPRR